jgi:hypothetical protein
MLVLFNIEVSQNGIIIDDEYTVLVETDLSNEELEMAIKLITKEVKSSNGYEQYKEDCYNLYIDELNEKYGKRFTFYDVFEKMIERKLIKIVNVNHMDVKFYI